MPIADMPFIPDVLLRIEQAAEDEGWDQPAALYALHAEEVTDECTAVGVAEFPGFDLAMGMTGHCYHALRAVIHALAASGPARPDLSGLFGIVLVDEAWMVKQEPGAPHPTGSLADHPDRIEQRFVWLIAADRSTKVLIRTRGAAEPVWSGEWKEGRLVDATAELLAVALDR